MRCKRDMGYPRKTHMNISYLARIRTWVMYTGGEDFISEVIIWLSQIYLSIDEASNLDEGEGVTIRLRWSKL